MNETVPRTPRATDRPDDPRISADPRTSDAAGAADVGAPGDVGTAGDPDASGDAGAPDGPSASADTRAPSGPGASDEPGAPDAPVGPSAPDGPNASADTPAPSGPGASDEPGAPDAPVGPSAPDGPNASADTPAPSGPGAAGRSRRVLRRLLAASVALPAAWLIPLGTQALHADAALPPLILLVVAALLRAGRTVLDRLVLALALLIGAACVAGLLFSVWPWGLSPVPVAGGAGTGLALIAVLIGRRPRLPRRVAAGDLIVLALTGLAALSVYWPYRHLSPAGRLAMLVPGGDLADHFTLVDAIRGTGGYAFLRHGGATAEVWSAYRTYPQGPHLVGALLTGFARSSAARGTPLAELDAFVWFQPATFVLLCLALLWSVRRLAGPGVPARALLPVAALGTGYLLWSDPLMIMWIGGWPELAGLAELALLVAMLARPLHRTREQVLVVTALVVALAFSCPLVLPVAAVPVLAWLIASRRRLAAHRAFTIPALLLGAAAAAAMPAVILTGSPADRHLLLVGAQFPTDHRRMLVFGLLACAGLLGVGGSRSPARRTVSAGLLAALLLTLLAHAIELHRFGRPAFLSDESIRAVTLMCLLALGPAARLLGALGRPHTGPAHGPAPSLAQGPACGPAQGSAHGPARGLTQGPVQGPAHGLTQDPAHGPAHGLTQDPAQRPAHGTRPRHAARHGRTPPRVGLGQLGRLGRLGVGVLGRLGVGRLGSGVLGHLGRLRAGILGRLGRLRTGILGRLGAGVLGRSGQLGIGGQRIERPGRAGSGSSARARSAGLVPCLALTLAALAAYGPFGAASYGRAYLQGSLAWHWPARTAILVSRRVPADGALTVVWAGRGYPQHATLWTNALLRQPEPATWSARYRVAALPATGPVSQAAIVMLVRSVAPRPVRFVTDDPTTLGELRSVQHTHPGLPLTVVAMRLPPG